ncbi:hypothetical protein MMC29_006151, partial [Sticta canariensis]|nr:hypothetical protein [Sticta canariensis]
MDRISAGRIGGHHLSEQIDTPMPLRISKKQEPEYPDHYRRQRSITIAPSSTLQSLRTVPSRQTSLPRSQTQPGILGERTGMSSARGSNEMHSLHVPKQRNTTATVSAPNPVTSAYPVKPYHHGTTPPTPLQGSSKHLSNENTVPKARKKLKENKFTFSIDKTPHRARTIGSILSTELLSPFNNGPLIPAAPTPLVTRSRSSATARQGFNGDVKTYERNDQAACQGLSRRVSLRGRFMSRVMSGLTSRQNISFVPTEHDGRTKDHKEITQKPHDETTMKHRDEIAPKHGEETSRHPSGGSTLNRTNSTASSGLYSNSLIGSVLDNTLLAFPTPPMISTMTSPTTNPSMATTRAGIVMPGSSPTFEGTAVVGAEITTVAETTHLESEDARSVFVAVEIKGTLSQPEDAGDPRHHGLEVVVVIDNSLFTSPATLMASCEGARYLASLLDMPDDKIAILCTSPERLNSQSMIVYPLSAVNVRQIKSAVDSIVASTDQPNHEATWATIECAKELFTSPTSSRSRDSLGTSGQLFVCTGNPSGLPPTLLHQGLHIHVVCPGTVPWKGQRHVMCNGWKMRSLCRSEPEFVAGKNGPDITALSTLFQTAVSRARGGKVSGRLTDLVLEVNAGHNCSIEGVMGKKTYPSLRPGEIITVLVKVKVGAWRRYGSSSSHGQDSNSPPNSYDLLDELDLMLGATSTTLLTARLKYKHSLFPSGTWCSISAHSQVKHHVFETKGDKDLSKAVQHTVWVQKRLIFHLATHHSPRNAIVTLIGQFGVDGRHSVCPNYFKLVIDELKYQARVLERLESSDVNSITANDQENDYEHFGEGLFDFENFKPIEWMPETQEQSEKDSPGSVQAEAWNSHALDLGGVSNYDTRVEGVWLANTTHKDVISIGPKHTERGHIPNTADKDDGSDHSTVVGAQSKYTLDAPFAAPDTRSPRELAKPASKENRPFADAKIVSHQIHPGNRIKNMGSHQPKSVGEPRSWCSDDEGDLYPVSPLTSRANKSSFRPPPSPSPPKKQSTTIRMTSSLSDSSDDAHKIWNDMGKLSMGGGGGDGDGNHWPPTRPKYGGGGGGGGGLLLLRSPPPEYPQVIVAKDEEERMRLMREFALKNQRSLGEGTLRSFAA